MIIQEELDKVEKKRTEKKKKKTTKPTELRM